MSAATLTSKGQTTIPKDIREGLGLRTGDRLEFHLLSNGSASMRVKRGTLKDFVGILHRPGMVAVSHEAMDEGIAAAVRARRSVGGE
jgi:AbrB family looped-hinge helix DNA binding protein